MTVIQDGTKANALDGPAYLYYAPTSVAVATRVSDVIDVETPYAAKTGWIKAGYTEDASAITRDMESEEYFVEQVTVSILERITQVNRTFKLVFAEHTPELLKIIEEGSTVTTLAASANRSAEKVVDVGSISTVTRYRWAIIAERDPGFGNIVVESGAGAPSRGTLIGFLPCQAGIAAEASEWEIKKGDLSSREVTFRLFPEPTISDPAKQHGRFAFEQAGTILPA